MSGTAEYKLYTGPAQKNAPSQEPRQRRSFTIPLQTSVLKHFEENSPTDGDSPSIGT